MSLYLKYRPSDFTSLVWQNFTKQTLQKAISEKKTVGAYIFCGPRWTGKTSSARIFAKAINCLDLVEWNPCLKCKVCTDFRDEKLLDIIEIDAASHTGVDNIREIIGKAQFTPNFCKYKIYIIDEVHMLSKWAFNALLKILEEPPSHVKFILATTETHKVPETIISRCQRYDFRRISAEDIKNRLLFIWKQEWITIDEKSLNYIVKNSGWGLRNAISIFEQLIHDSEINYDQVVEKLWIVDDEVLSRFLAKLLSKDITIISDFDELIDRWKNIKLFFKELIFYIKNKTLTELKNNSNISPYISLLEILDETYSKTKISLDENTTFIIWLLKIVSWYSQDVKTRNSISNTIKSQITPEKKSEVVTKIIQTTKSQKPNEIISPEKKEKEKISHNDAYDVFGKSSQDDKVKNNNKSQFDSKIFIEILKKSWAKWGLTMALRWSWLELIWDTLIIRTKTKIAAGQISLADNIGLMTKALENMWIDTPEIKTV